MMNDELRMKLTEFLKKYFSKLCEFIPQFITRNSSFIIILREGVFKTFIKVIKNLLKYIVLLYNIV